MGYLISETTKEEREKIVAESLGNIDAACDGCMSGLVEMYQDYIDGKLNIAGILFLIQINHSGATDPLSVAFLNLFNRFLIPVVL